MSYGQIVFKDQKLDVLNFESEVEYEGLGWDETITLYCKPVKKPMANNIKLCIDEIIDNVQLSVNNVIDNMQFGINEADIYFKYTPFIENVIFNDPATVVFWNDGTKTVVKCGSIDNFDPEKGLAMAIAKKALGNQGNYFETIKKWTKDK